MKLLITREIPQAGINILKQYPEIELDYRQGKPLTEKELIEAIKHVDAIIPVIPDRITEDIIKAGKNLKIISTYSVGYDHIDTITATKHKVYVSNTPGDLTESVSEFSLALLMSVSKKIVEGDTYCRKNHFKFWEPMKHIGPRLRGKTLGIIGFGRIGQQFAKMAKYGLDMEIVYVDLQRHLEAENLLNAKKVELDELLGNSDIVSVHCNLTQETHHLIGEQQFSKMKPNAILINTARGPIVNEKALVKALDEKIIAGAGLDVFEDEPTINAKLKEMDNVVMTPHIASATWEARIEMATMAVNNVVEVLIKKQPPTNLVNKDMLEKCVTSLV
jgi:lactate dehydrogenase-like 2-hydroxyacid dehydrogenase